MTERQKIDDFLGQKRLALVGVSRSGKHFTRLLWREFVKRGYDVVPVNPNMEELDGRKCYRSVAEIEPPVDGALIATRPEAAANSVEDCAKAGVRRVWLYRARGTGAATPAAVEGCQRGGLDTTVGCPFMFFRKPGFLHGFHGWLLKLSGSYPR